MIARFPRNQRAFVSWRAVLSPSPLPTRRPTRLRVSSTSRRPSPPKPEAKPPPSSHKGGRCPQKSDATAAVPPFSMGPAAPNRPGERVRSPMRRLRAGGPGRTDTRPRGSKEENACGRRPVVFSPQARPRNALEGGALPCSRPARFALRAINDVHPRQRPAARLSPP
jgi:hypothetical protein